MPKRDITPFAQSTNLKTKMTAKGYPQTLDEGMAFWTAAGEIWAITGSTTFGALRCVGNTIDFTDIIDANGQTLVRAWAIEELENWIFHNLHPVDYTVTKPATQFVVTITIGENQFVGQDANKTQAVAKAILAALN